MRAWLVLALLIAGCTGPTGPLDGGSAGAAPACPGHFHITLLAADGDEVLPYFTPDDMDARGPVEGIHMHADDGVIHIHPPVEACYVTGGAFFAVGVHLLERNGGALQVGDDVRNGTLRVDVQLWGEEWQTVHPSFTAETVPDASRWLLMVNPPDDVEALRAQVPPIPAAYRPS